MAVPTPTITDIINHSAGVYIGYNNNATLADNVDTIYCYRGTTTNPTEQIDSRASTWFSTIGYTAFQYLYDFNGHEKDIEGNTRYYYRLRSSYNGTYGDYSATSSIVTCPASTYAQLINSTSTSATFSISCEPSGSELTTHLKYIILDKKSGSTTTVDTGITNLQGSTTTYTINNLSPNNTYSVYFYLENTSGNGRYSIPIPFNTFRFYGPKSGSQTSSTASSKFTLSDTANMGLYSELNSSSSLDVKMYGDTKQQTATGVPNLFNINATPTWIGANTSYSVSGRSLTVIGGWFVAFPISVKANTNYYISAIRSNLSSHSSAGHIFVYSGSTGGSNIFETTTNGYFNTGSATTIRVGFRCGFADTDQGTATFTNIQLKEGTTELGYSAYNKISGNLMPLVPVTGMTPNWTQQATYEYVWDDELKRTVLHIVGNGNYPGISFALSPYMTYSTGRNYAVSVRYKLIANKVSPNGGYGGVSFNGRNNWELLGNETTGWTKNDNPDATNQTPTTSLRQSDTWTTATVRTSKDATPTYTPNKLTVELREALYSGVNCELWISDIEVREITDAEYAANTYTPTFTPYTDGYVAPSPDYSMPIETVTGLQTINITGSNGESQEYEINLGKNLCPTTTENLYLVANTGTAGKISGNSGVSIAVEQNTDYTISVQSSQVRYRVGFVDTIPQNDYDTVTAYNGANGDGTSNTLTVNSGSHNYLIVNVTDLTACQVEKGSTATSFAPYFTPIELCKIGTYQDYIYKSDGKWYLHKEISRINLAIADMNNTTNYPGWSNTTETNQLKSDSEVSGSWNPGNLYNLLNAPYTTNIKGLVSIASGNNINVNFNGSNSQIFLNKDIFGLTQEEWMAQYPNLVVNLYYRPKTPTDTEITNEGLVEDLEEFASLAHAYPESTTFSTRGSLPTLLNGNFPYTDGTDTSERIAKLYGSVDGKTKEVKKLYGSVNGKTKLILNNS